MPASQRHIYTGILPINSYQTAWTMLAKLRSVMGSDHSTLLAGRVAIDETFFGGPNAGGRGRGTLGKTMVAGAIRVTSTGWGRARLGVILDAKAPTLQRFITAHIATDSTIVTDGLTSYPGATVGYVHQPISVSATGKPAHESLQPCTGYLPKSNDQSMEPTKAPVAPGTWMNSSSASTGATAPPEDWYSCDYYNAVWPVHR